MHILAISDTHSRLRSEIPDFLLEMKGTFDLIFHAGDIVGEDFLLGLEEIAPVVGVRGNMDSDAFAKNLPELRQFDYHGWSFGLIHGRGRGDTVPAYARSMFARPDVILFGHTHVPLLEVRQDVVMLNPGSLTSPRIGTSGSYALIQFTETDLECRILSGAGSEVEEIAQYRSRRPL